MNDDTSYVSLSLEKYNELYDKAKAYDEIAEKMSDDLKDLIDKMYEVIVRIANDEESAATTEEVDTEIKVGDKVRILENDVNAPVGVVGTILAIKNDGILHIKDDEKCIWMLPDKKYVEKINEGEEN